MSVQTKSIIIGILLILALSITAFFAVETFQSFREFQRQHALIMAGDVRAIRPWMTIPYVAHEYQVPERYLYQSLRITDPQHLQHDTLHALAMRYNRPVNDVVHTLQGAIQVYRKHHPYKHKTYWQVPVRSMSGGIICHVQAPPIQGYPLVERMCP